MAAEVNRPVGREQILDAVLDAAEEQFAAAGPTDVSLRAIARAAGVNYGLLHRHVGTKDRLFDLLLERYAERWSARIDGVDYLTALDELLGPSPETRPYLRVLAWTLLSDRADAAASPGRHATLDRLLALPGGGDNPAATAAALALVFGWRFFHPFIRDALHLDRPDAELHAAIREQLHRVASGA